MKQRHLPSKDLPGADPPEFIFRGLPLCPSTGNLVTFVGSLPARRLFAVFCNMAFPSPADVCKGPRGAPPSPSSSSFTQRINQILCSRSLETESSLLALCYDLHGVCKSHPQIHFSCSSGKAICFVNNLTDKDAETATANGRMESISRVNRETKGHGEHEAKCQPKRVIVRKGENKAVG